MLTMNIPAAPQIQPSADNSITINNAGSSGTQESATEEFAKVLEREVSETSGKQEVNSHTGKSEESQGNISLPSEGNSASTLVKTAPISEPLVNNVFFDTGHAHMLDQSFLPLDMPSNPDVLTALISPTALSPLPLNSSLLQDSNLAANTIPLASQMLQQKPMQTAYVANNTAYSLSDFWQSMDMAESAANGKFLPFSSEMSEAIQMNTGEATFSISTEPVSTQTFGLSNATSTTPLQTSPQHIQVDQQVGQPKWGGEFAQKIVWLTSQQHQVAEIHLNPVHLGPVDVMLSISQDQATAQFSSPHLAVREAIQEALPRLREMMAENGIQLGNVMVGADSFQQENKQQQSYSQARSNANETSVRTDAMGQMETTVAINRHHGMVNTYA